MRFSVVIPCYNAGPWIQSALRSVAAQTVPAHEIIVVDDGSTDDSVARIESSGVGLRLLHTRRANAAGARNAGIQAAGGDWIALLDADDVWYPNHLARAAALLGGSDPDPGYWVPDRVPPGVPGAPVAFMAAHDCINVRGEPVPMASGFKCAIYAPTRGLGQRRFLQEIVGGLHFGHSTVVYRRDRLLEVGTFDVEQTCRQDIDLWLRVIRGRTWCYDTTKAAAYRTNTPGSISRDLVRCEYYYLRAAEEFRGLPLPGNADPGADLRTAGDGTGLCQRAARRLSAGEATGLAAPGRGGSGLLLPGRRLPAAVSLGARAAADASLWDRRRRAEREKG